MFDPTKYTKSRWMKGADLPPGQPVMGTIKAAYEYTFEQSDDTMPVLDFYDLEQSMTLNKTQTMAMINLFGTDPTQWIGKAINLMAVPSNYQGKPTILITAANTAPAATPTNDTDDNPSPQGLANEVQFQ